jgi:transcriptional regulator with XRE-family HTH domain
MPRRPASTRFGQNLRIARQASGLTQAQVAEASGIAVETVSRLERGHQVVVSLDLAEKLAKAVKIPLADLLGAMTFETPLDTERPMMGRIVSLLAPLDDEALADVYHGLRRLLGVRSRPRRG